MNTKDYLGEYVIASISQERVSKLFQGFLKLCASWLTYEFLTKTKKTKIYKESLIENRGGEIQKYRKSHFSDTQ